MEHCLNPHPQTLNSEASLAAPKAWERNRVTTSHHGPTDRLISKNLNHQHLVQISRLDGQTLGSVKVDLKTEIGRFELTVMVAGGCMAAVFVFFTTTPYTPCHGKSGGRKVPTSYSPTPES